MDSGTLRDAWATISPEGASDYKVMIYAGDGRCSDAHYFGSYRRARRWAQHRIEYERRRLQHEAGEVVTVK